MRISLLAASVVTTAYAASGLGAEPPRDAPLVIDKSVRVDVLDVEANLTRIPQEKRAEFRMSYDRIAGVVDGVFVARSFAEKARALGLDQDPLIQRRMQQVQEDVLAAAYAEKVENDVAAIDLEQRAKELYKADTAKYSVPEIVRVQDLLIDLKGRTREMARERANEVYAKAKAGEDFLALAQSQGAELPKVDLDYAPPTAFVPPLRDRLAKMQPKDISEPVETSDGFHILRLVDRKARQQLDYETVRKSIIASERQRLKKQKLDAELLQVRSSQTSRSYPENVEKLVVVVDPTVIRKAVEAGNAATQKLDEKQAK